MTEDSDRIRSAARLLHEALAHRDAFQPLPPGCAPRDLDEAYAIQAQLQALRAPALGPIAGWKVAGIAAARRRRLGLLEPVFSGIHASRIHRGATVLRAADHVHLALEAEIAVELAIDVPAGTARDLDVDRAGALVARAMPAFEIVDDRFMRHPPPAALLNDAIACNAGNAGLIVGAGAIGAGGLVDLGARLRICGRFAGESTAGATAGDPLEALAWLVRTLSGRGVALPAGTLVTTGSLGPAHFLEPGEDAVLEIDGLGEVAVGVV